MRRAKVMLLICCNLEMLNFDMSMSFRKGVQRRVPLDELLVAGRCLKKNGSYFERAYTCTGVLAAASRQKVEPAVVKLEKRIKNNLK